MYTYTYMTCVDCNKHDKKKNEVKKKNRTELKTEQQMIDFHFVSLDVINVRKLP